MPIIESLTTELGFDIDEKTLDDFDKALGTTVKLLTAVVVGAAAAGSAIFAFTKKVAESNDETFKFAQRIGIGVEDLQEWGAVAELNGGSIDSMNASLENLNKTASEAARGTGSGVETFGLLGISVTDVEGRLKSANDLMFEVADSIGNLSSQAEKAELSQKLGISGDLLLSLTQGSEAIKKQREEARELGLVFDREAGQAAERFVDNMWRLSFIVKGVSSQIGTKLMKQMNPMIEAFTEWFKINSKLIQQNLTKFLGDAVRVIRIVFSVLARVVGVVNSLVQAIGGWKVALGAAAAAWMILNASVLLMPALIIAAAAGLFLLIEDIIKFAEGGDSMLGDLAKRFPQIGIELNWLIDLLKTVVKGWNLIFKNGPEMIDFTIERLKALGSAITEFFYNPLDSVFGLIDKIFPTLKDSEILHNINSLVTGQPQIPASAGGGSSVTNNSTGGSTVVNINGGDLPEVKRVVKEAMNEQNRNAATNLKSPVDF